MDMPHTFEHQMADILLLILEVETIRGVTQASALFVT